MTQVEIADAITTKQLIFKSHSGMLSKHDENMLDSCLAFSEELYIGRINDELVCAWGLIPPTLLSDQAYLWLYSTDAIKDHQFIFVRNSQRVVENMLRKYPVIVGHTAVGATRSRRWLQWLGAKFDKSDGRLIRFEIRRAENHGSN